MQNNNYNNGMYEGIVSEVWQTKSGKKLGYIKYDTDKSVFFYNENSPGFSRNILNADTLEVDDKVKFETKINKMGDLVATNIRLLSADGGVAQMPQR